VTNSFFAVSTLVESRPKIQIRTLECHVTAQLGCERSDQDTEYGDLPLPYG
jgi:hypothetical protein